LNRGGLILALLLACLVSACRTNPAPGAKRISGQTSYQLTKDGHYRVRKGDTLHAIAFNFGLDWRDIASWNHIRVPYVIYPDQELRLTPPRHDASSSAKPKSRPTPVDSKSLPPPVAGKTETGPPSATTTSALKTPQASTSPRRPSASDTVGTPSKWLWPANGRIISKYKANDSSRNGIDISGKEGQAIIATAPGEVVYSGSGLTAYGELIIIKHSDRLLSAYAHNRKRLVAEGQIVKAGAQIAEMGRNDRNQALLHFEIRVDGIPKNPLDYLPRR